MTDTARRCPACGLAGYFKAQSWDANGAGVIGTGICPCCLFEPGFDDDPAASADALTTVRASTLHYRRQWIAMGMPWRGDDDDRFSRPKGWNAEGQLAELSQAEPGSSA